MGNFPPAPFPKFLHQVSRAYILAITLASLFTFHSVTQQRDKPMHPLVRDLYRRAILIGRDYPHPEGLSYVRRVWKQALQNPENCPSWYKTDSTEEEKERELRKAVARGRYLLREMVGVIQLKKYRSLKQIYGGGGESHERNSKNDTDRLLTVIHSTDLTNT